MDAVRQALQKLGLDASDVAVGLAAAVLLLILTLAVGLAIVVRVPARYFVDPEGARPGPRHPALRFALRVAKNLLGAMLVLAGLVLAVPGVPGPGVATILLGLLLLDLPGKKRFERRIVASPKVLASVNRLRHRFGREPLVVDDGSRTT